MKKKLLAVFMTMVMAGSAIVGTINQDVMVAAAATEDPYAVETLEGEVPTEQQNYMTDTQYKKMLGIDLNSKTVDAFDPDNTYNPLDGYQPTVLNELFLGYMNRTNNYDGKFAVMENASTDDGFNLDTMWDTNYGGVNTYYGEDQNEDMHTHAINTIAVTPGDLTEEDAATRQQILIENRIYLKEDGALREDDVHQMLTTYAMVKGSWVRNECYDTYLDDGHWAWDIDVAEQQSYTAMAVGDYDGDNYNEVAVYVPSNTVKSKMARVEIYELVKNDDGTYWMALEYEIQIDEMGSRFDVWMDKYHSYVHLNTTKLAGRDDLVISVTQPFLSEDEFTDNGALAVWSFQGGNKKLEYNNDLEYNGYRFKMSATANADLNGDGTDELVVGGFKNTNYAIDGQSRGVISDSENLVNILLYEDGAYELAWGKPQVTGAVDLDHSREADAPVAMAAGRYRSGSMTDTVFLEGTYLDFKTGVGSTVNDQIRNGMFSHDSSENISGDMSDATINIGASGSFVSDKTAMEQVVFCVNEASNSGHSNVDVDIVWGHPGGTGGISTDVINNNYISDTEEDDGTIVTMCPLNVDDDTAMMKYTGKSVGWSNPVVYGVLMSMPYWQEMDYGSVWNDRGQTDLGVTKTTEDSTEVTVGVDVEKSLSLSGELTVLGSGISLGVDFSFLSNYAYGKTDTTSLAKSLTWSSGAGVDSAAVMVMPVVSYKYDIIVPEHQATEEEKKNGKTGTIEEYSTTVLCTSTYEPVYTDVPVETYNDVVEEFNVMAEASGNNEDKLPLIDMDEIYAGAKVGDPSSYADSPENISSVEGDDYLYVGEAYAQPDNDKGVTTLNIETSTSTTESNGFSLGLKGGYMGEIITGADLASIISTTGKIGMGVSAQIGAGGTWATTTSTGITYSGCFVNVPSAAAGYGYEYSAGLVKWDASLAGLDKDLTFEDSDEVLTDKTVVIAPTVSMDAMVPPALPSDLHVLGVTTDTAVLEWTNPVGSRVPDYYKIYYSKDDSRYYPLEGTVDGDKTRKVIKGLNADSTYYFKIESYDSETSLRSVMSAPVTATTKTGSEPVITKHPADRYAKVGETAMFSIGAESQTEGNTLSYQWQQLSVDDFGISWTDINVASDSSIGRIAEFNAAYASPDGVIRQQDVDDLDGNVYRCVVAEHESGKLEYTETISNTATLYAGEENLPTETSLKIEATEGTQSSDSSIQAATGDDITVSSVLTDKDGNAIEGVNVHFALMDKNQDNKCIAYLTETTDADGKASAAFEDIAAGQYEVTAVMFKQGDKYRAAVSNSIEITAAEVYEIIYELDGGINHNLNPIKYALGTKFIILRDAAKKGHEFTGWYLDTELKQLISGNVLNISEMEGPITLYAGWKELAEEEGEDPGQKPDDGDGTGTDEPDQSPDEDKNAGTDETEQLPDNEIGDVDQTQTGDDSNLTIAIVLMIVALGVCMAAVLLNRRKK